jgi:hypothetical protein
MHGHAHAQCACPACLGACRRPNCPKVQPSPLWTELHATQARIAVVNTQDPSRNRGVQRAWRGGAEPWSLCNETRTFQPSLRSSCSTLAASCGPALAPARDSHAAGNPRTAGTFGGVGREESEEHDRRRHQPEQTPQRHGAKCTRGCDVRNNAIDVRFRCCSLSNRLSPVEQAVATGSERSSNNGFVRGVLQLHAIQPAEGARSRRSRSRFLASAELTTVQYNRVQSRQNFSNFVRICVRCKWSRACDHDRSTAHSSAALSRGAGSRALEQLCCNHIQHVLV